MDIHRSRFVPYQPSAINTLAFSHTSGRSLHGQPLKLAVGRANGDIEIWNPLRGNWAQEIIIRGGKGRSCEGLVWTHDPDQIVRRGISQDSTKHTHYGRSRLFSIGYSSTIVEWDLCTGLPRRESSGVGGEVWCLDAQPAVERERKKKSKRSKSTEDKKTEHAHEEPSATPEYQHLVAGCADGTLVLLSTEDDDLVFKKYIARASKKNARALSLCFQDRNTVVAGFSDSTIRVYDIRNGKLIRNMSLGGNAPSGGPKDKLVWAVDCLRDGTIVSGDSSGEVTFWDPRTYGILQRIKGHEADVLCLATNIDGSTVFSGGMDRRTCVYNMTGSAGQRKIWSKTSHQRLHQHDVKAMARFHSDKMSVIASGGLDTAPIMLPLREFGKEYHRALPYLPHTPPLTATGRLIVSWEGSDVIIWRIFKSKDIGAEKEDAPKYQNIARLALKGDEYISSVAISSNARVLAVATTAEIKLFHLRSNKAGALKIRRIDGPVFLSKAGARIVQFSTDSRWLLIVDPNNQLRATRVIYDRDPTARPSIHPTSLDLRRLKREAGVQSGFNGEWGSYDRVITRCVFSDDGLTLAVADLAGYIDTFSLVGKEKVDANSNNDTRAVTVDAPPSPPSSDCEMSDSDSDSEISMTSISHPRTKRVPRIFDQHWRLTPSSHLLPRASAAPLILSFRPSSSSNAKAGESLLVITAMHEILEYSILHGKLTDWSRRNPSALLPDRFKMQRDRALGCIWDVAPPHAGQAGRERLWLYGPTWLCMFDLTKDFPRPANTDNPATTNGDTALTQFDPAQQSKKRKRYDTSSALDSKRNTTGLAGSSIPDYERAGAVGPSRQKTGASDWTTVHADRHTNIKSSASNADSNEDVDMDMDMDPLDEIAFLTAPVDGEKSETEKEEQATSGASEAEVENESTGLTRKQLRARKYKGIFNADGSSDDGRAPLRRTLGYMALDKSFFITTKYRPILGIVRLVRDEDDVGLETVSPETNGHTNGIIEQHGNGHSKGKAKGKQTAANHPVPEVVIVERPFWDLKLPPRFAGAQEWNEK